MYGWMHRLLGVTAVVGCLLYSPVATVAQASADEPITGIWYSGERLDDGTEVGHIVEIYRRSDGLLRGSLIDLGNMGVGLPATTLTFADGTLSLEIDIAMIEYRAQLQTDGRTLDGRLYNRFDGSSSPLLLRRVDEVPGLRRPQRLTPPYPYREEFVVFPNPQTGNVLGGTLSLPSTPGRHPAALLVTGSGPQDRDETLAYHRPFHVLADHLTRAGIAVLRVDDRGMGESTGTYSGATCDDFAGDARAGLAFLRSHPAVDADQVGLIGHSEGAIVTQMVASGSEVAFAVLLAGPGRDGRLLIDLQHEFLLRAAGRDEAEISFLVDWGRRLDDLVVDEPDQATAVRGLLRLWNDLSPAEQGIVGWSRDDLALAIAVRVSPQYQWLLAFDPDPLMQTISCPVLALWGDRDLQVPSQVNALGMEASLMASGHRDYSLVTIPGLNHLFQHSQTGAPSEYMQIEETYAPVALDAIAAWLSEHTTPPSTATAVRSGGAAPTAVRLAQNHPNPFNASSTIPFELAHDARVRLTIFTALGQKVIDLVDGSRSAGRYSVVWDGRDAAGRAAASGTYFYALEVGSESRVKRLSLVR